VLKPDLKDEFIGSRGACRTQLEGMARPFMTVKRGRVLKIKKRGTSPP